MANPIKFKVFLLNRGVKQVDLARACGLQEARVSRFATGREVPKEGEVALMAEALSMTAAQLRKAGGW